MNHTNYCKVFLFFGILICLIVSLESEMSFSVKDNKTLYVMLSDRSLHICENALSYQSFKLNNVEACFIYDSLSCP